MRAVNGFFENGQFMPNEYIHYTKRVPAVLVLNDIENDENHNEKLSWLTKFHTALKLSEGEELPEFIRIHSQRECIDLSDEE